MANPNRRAVFLDRDGTIILDRGYVKEAQEVCLLAGAGEALATIQRHGFALVLISNQSGIDRGLIRPEQAEQVHQAMVTQLLEYGVRLDAAYYCPHTPEASCRCRKPSPEMIVQAARELPIDLARSFMIGDKACDIEAGKRAGCQTILLANQGDGPAMPQTSAVSAPLRATPSRSVARRGAETAERKQNEGVASEQDGSLVHVRPDGIAYDWTEVLRQLLSTEGM